jgi:hypothetical protein
MTKEINVYIEENNVNTCIYIYTELAHMQDKGIDKIDGLPLSCRWATSVTLSVR